MSIWRGKCSFAEVHSHAFSEFCAPQSFADLRTCGPADLRTYGPADLRTCGAEFLRNFFELCKKCRLFASMKNSETVKNFGFQNVFYFGLVGGPPSATSVGGSFDTRPTAGIRCVIPLLKRKSF